MKKLLVFALVLSLSPLSFAQKKESKEAERLRDAARVLDEILKIPENIPQELLDKAECVIVLPSVKKVALGIGASYGRGAMICRSGEKYQGAWGPAAMYQLEGGNIGFQIGGQATDFVLLVMNPKGVESMLKTKAKLGADASAAAGPKGRAATAATDPAMNAEVLSYSRAKGAFAGVSLEGASLKQDNDANEKIYGKKISAQEILRGGNAEVPDAGRALVTVLTNASPTNKSE